MRNDLYACTILDYFCRSATCVAAYLMMKHNMTATRVNNIIKKRFIISTSYWKIFLLAYFHRPCMTWVALTSSFLNNFYKGNLQYDEFMLFLSCIPFTVDTRCKRVLEVTQGSTAVHFSLLKAQWETQWMSMLSELSCQITLQCVPSPSSLPPTQPKVNIDL